MKFKYLLLFTCLIGLLKVNAQQEKVLSLQEAIDIALTKGNSSKISNNKVDIAKEELKTTKNSIYPDFELSGQYQYLTNPDIDLQISGLDDSSSESTDVNKFMIGQATVTMPLFAGFKIKNLVKASENKYQASIFYSKSEKEQIALKIIKDYTDLYKSKKTILLIKENLVRAKQRVKDFTEMEQNGLLAKNDLLKAIIQESNIGISLKEAHKNAYMLNYQLVTDLKLPENTELSITGNEFEIVESLANQSLLSETDSFQRNDLKALEYEELASENQIKAIKSKYYPSISFVGGYTSLDINNLLTVTNAMNFGVGISYNISDIFKSKSEIKTAQNRAKELQYTIDMTTDNIKVQIENALQEYELAIEKFEVYSKTEEQTLENYRIVKDKYDNGLVDTNDLLEADIEQLQSTINLTYIKADITQKFYELLAAKGQLTNKFQIK